MKLYNARYILPALGVFLVAVTFPVWRGAVACSAGFQSPPNPKGERCIEPKRFMRAQHMHLLEHWRDEVVRENLHVYTASNGRRWDKSLRTCVACHGQMDAQGKSTTAAAACTQCHNYVNAKLDCWNCHQEKAASPVQVAIGHGTTHPSAPEEASR